MANGASDLHELCFRVVLDAHFVCCSGSLLHKERTLCSVVRFDGVGETLHYSEASPHILQSGSVRPGTRKAWFSEQETQ